MYYEIVTTTVVDDSTRALTKFSLPHVGKAARRRILESILDESEASILIEPISRSGKGRKWRYDFHGLLVFPKHKSSER